MFEGTQTGVVHLDAIIWLFSLCVNIILLWRRIPIRIPNRFW
jgi:hypothetical protein